MNCDRADCKFLDSGRCDTCINFSRYEQKQIKKPKKLKSRNTNKADGRKGSNAEKINHDKNVIKLKEITSNMTVNSGATRREKGDENISGYYRVAQEIKTQDKNRAKGTNTFTIHREWLTKLCRESQQNNQEAWYLVFSFHENEAANESEFDHPEGNLFAIVEAEMLLNMVATISEDRYRADLAAMGNDIAHKENEVLNAEISKLRAENELFKSKIALLEKQVKGIKEH